VSEIVGELAGYLGLWFVAGFIATMFTVLVIVLTGGLAETVTELLLVAVVESFPFPFNLLVGWHINACMPSPPFFICTL